MNRTIRITGKGQLKVMPDTTRITISLEGTYPEYSDTLNRSAKETEILKDILSKRGFERTDLKTTYFNIDMVKESYREHGAYKNKLVGYKFTHIMKLEFDSDNKRLGDILALLSHCPIKPELNLTYTVKDPEASKNQLLENAVNDAKRKAEVLAKAAGVQLGSIVNIDYSWGTINIESESRDCMICASVCEEEADYSVDIEPDDIDLSDTVTVVWEIL